MDDLSKYSAVNIIFLSFDDVSPGSSTSAYFDSYTYPIDFLLNRQSAITVSKMLYVTDSGTIKLINLQRTFSVGDVGFMFYDEGMKDYYFYSTSSSVSRIYNSAINTNY
jgi:hypothetical protein